jgi:hypothetical protein
MGRRAFVIFFRVFLNKSPPGAVSPYETNTL